MTFMLGARRIRLDLGHMLFVTAIGCWCVWYLFDARASSTNFQNLLLIQPSVIVALCLVIAIVKSTIHVQPREIDRAPRQALAPADASETVPPPPVHSAAEDRREVLRVFGFMALLAVYLVLIPRIGLDVATFLFVAACLLGQGERRPLIAIGIPLIFTAVAVYGFKMLLAIPIPTLLG